MIFGLVALSALQRLLSPFAVVSGTGRDARVASRVQGEARVAPRITTHCENYADEDGAEASEPFFASGRSVG